MSAFTLSPVGPDPATTPPGTTDSDNAGGGAGRGGAQNPSQSPLVVVQGGRQPSPPRPAPSPSTGNQENSLRNGYAAISHGVSGETAAIGVGFLVAGPVGAIVGGAALPALVAASMWRARRREHDANSNNGTNGTGDSASGRDQNGAGTSNRGNGAGGGGHRSPNGSGGAGSGTRKTPKTNGNGSGKGTGTGDSKKKPKTKDPVADKLSKAGKALADKLKNRDKNGPKGKSDGAGKGGKDKPGKSDKTPKDSKHGAGGAGKTGTDPKHKNNDKNGKGKGDGTAKGLKDGLKDGLKRNDPKNSKDSKDSKDGGPKGLKDGLKDGLKVTDRGKRPPSDRPWRDRGPKEKTPKDKNDKSKGDGTSKDDGATSSTARDGLEPKKPKGPKGPKGGSGAGTDDIIDAELIDDDLPPKPDRAPDDSDDIVDAEIIEDRISLVRAKRERARRRRAIQAGKQAAADAARDGTQGDPRTVKLEVTRQKNRQVDLELHRENQLLALAAATEHRRSKPVTYPVATTSTPGTRTAGVAVARQIDPRSSTAYRILVAMAEQLANGLHNDADADMADHIIELTGIPNMCRNLGAAVIEAGNALAKTAPLHPSVIKHLNNAATSARSAAVMSETIITVFVQAHREDIFRVMSPRIGEERWNLRNGPGTLDAAKLRAAIMSANTRRPALPAGTSAGGAASSSGGKLVPASDGMTKKLINLMKGFTKGHMTVVLSEVGGSASGVVVVADSITKLYRRMSNTWPTERVVDDTVRATASKVRNVSVELRKAIKQAQKLHERELRLNAKPRKGAKSESKWDVVASRGSSN